MKNKSKYYRIPVCIFIFVVGSITALLFASVLNDVLTPGSISTDLTDFSTTISGVFGGEKPRKLYLLLEALVVLLCVVYFVCAERTYKTDTYKVTDNISVPVPSGQGQHGTAWFMSDKTKRRAFDYISISPADPLVSRLVSIGRERYIAIENGEIFNPPKADQTLTHSAGIVLAREMSRGTERLPCITDDYHTLTIGATRCGKSRCLVLQSICALALAGEGIVANDPKGELYHYTHSFLETLGYKVHVIDFNTPKKSDRYNPLQSIINVVNENRIDDAQNCVWEFVTFLVEKNDHSEPIWTNGECSVIAAAVMCVVYDNQNHPEFQNLTNVYNFIANMCKTVNKVLPIDAYMDKLPDSHPAKKLMAIAKLAPDKMGGSFYTAALTTLRLFIGDLAVHLKTLQTFFRLYIPSMDDRLRAVLDQSLVELYFSFGITWETDVSGMKAERFPILSDLYSLISRKAESGGRNAECYADLKTYLEGAANGADHLLCMFCSFRWD